MQQLGKYEVRWGVFWLVWNVVLCCSQCKECFETNTAEEQTSICCQERKNAASLKVSSTCYHVISEVIFLGQWIVKISRICFHSREIALYVRRENTFLSVLSLQLFLTLCKSDNLKQIMTQNIFKIYMQNNVGMMYCRVQVFPARHAGCHQCVRHQHGTVYVQARHWGTELWPVSWWLLWSHGGKSVWLPR